MRVSRTTLSGLVLVLRLAPMYLAFGIAKHLVRVDRLARWAWRRPVATASRRDRERIVSLVLRLGAAAGQPDRDCLQRSLLLYRELSRSGADPRLLMGFRRDTGRLIGHAWVECDDRSVTTEALAGSEYEAVWSFGPEGRPLNARWASADRPEEPRPSPTRGGP